MDLKKLILFLLIMIFSSSIVFAGFFNTYDTWTFEMDKIDGFNTDEADGGDILSISNSKDSKHSYESIMIFETNSTYPYNNGVITDEKILKNYTNGNYTSFMTDENQTTAYMIINGKTYLAFFSHVSGPEEPAVYNEEVFMQDNERLQRYMSTIRAK